MLGNRHEFDMRESHFPDVGNQGLRKFPIAVVAAVGMSPPGCGMHLASANFLVASFPNFVVSSSLLLLNQHFRDFVQKITIHPNFGKPKEIHENITIFLRISEVIPLSVITVNW